MSHKKYRWSCLLWCIGVITLVPNPHHHGPDTWRSTSQPLRALPGLKCVGVGAHNPSEDLQTSSGYWRGPEWITSYTYGTFTELIKGSSSTPSYWNGAPMESEDKVVFAPVGFPSWAPHGRAGWVTTMDVTLQASYCQCRSSLCV